MKRKWLTFFRSYQEALDRYLAGGARASLRPATKLGRQAVALDLETLDLAMIHEQAVTDHALPAKAPATHDRLIRRAGVFFAEASLPLEATHRTARESHDHLHQLNQALHQRTVHLASSNRKLRAEIAKRQAVENALRKSERKSTLLLDRSQELQQQLRRLSRRVLSVQEEERRRISRELHDVIAQMLTGINVQLASLKVEAKSNTKGITRNIARTQRLVEKSVDIVHRFARELRPAVLDDLGLIPALHAFLKRFMKETGIRTSLTTFAGVETLSSAKLTTLYRVAQEALTNVARHAHASRVDVHISKQAKTVRMQIKDDGTAFDVETIWHARKSHHMGLLGMRERVEMVGGKLTLESAPGKGTTVQARIPFNNGTKEHT